MALQGTYQDIYQDMYKQVLLREAQQTGSRLLPTVSVEPMTGNKTFFQKSGKVSHTVKTTRNADRIDQDQTFERRFVQETSVEYSTLFDREDLIKEITNPMGSITQDAISDLARHTDSVIYAALKGNASVITNGSTTNQGLTLSIAVDDNTYGSESGDQPLNTSKLRLAIVKLRANYGIRGNERVFCVGPTDQIMHLSTETQTISSDFRGKKPLEGPGTIQGLSGFLNIDFIGYDEEVAVDSNADEKVFIYTESAVKMGQYIPLTVQVSQANDKQLSPDRLAVWHSIGATRMYEEKVVEVLCDPITS